MSILICTPCYGAMVTAQYLASALNLETELNKAGLDHDWLISWNESLITRGRDKMARTFLTTKYERMLFIDSDIQFSPEDVAKLWNLDADIAVGAYRNKKIGQVKGAWVNGKLVPLEDLKGITEVDYAGTGFMMIKRQVFEKLKEKHPEWAYDDATGGELAEHYGFFQDPIEDRTKLSEDYFFVKRAREEGFKVLLDPTINLTHWGQFGY